MDPSTTVRLAEPSDCSAIASIYNEGIEDRIATFETRPRTPDDIAGLMAGPYPIVSVESAGEVVAVAWCSQYRPRECYQGIVEFSVYVARLHRGHGFGRTAMERLLIEAEKRGFWKLVSRVFPENTASLALLRTLGFREVGVYHRHGKLDGQWRDCVIVEKLIGDGLSRMRYRTDQTTQS